MDRQIVYAGAIPLETDLLNTNRNTLIALGLLAADVLGTTTVAVGFPCTQTASPSLAVLVGPGRLYAQESVDATAYSSLAADTTDMIVKQGIQLGSVTLATVAPSTAGFSVNYLIEAQYQDVDGSASVLAYYNAANPAGALSGPGGLGAAQNAKRAGTVVLTAKAGIPATTGTQTTPGPDAGNVGLYVVTVANGQTTVTAPNISVYSGANFLTSTLSSLNTAIATEATNRAAAVTAAISTAEAFATSAANTAAASAQSTAESFATAAVASEASTRAAAVSAAISTAESFATSAAASAASTAQANAESYASGVASTAQTNAESFASSAATTAQNNAETYAAGTGSNTTSAMWVKLPGGQILQSGLTGSLAGGANTITFPKPFPTTCFVQVTPTVNSASWAITGLVSGAGGIIGFTMNTGATEPYYWEAKGY